MLRLQHALNMPAESGWLPLFTPLGALAHIEVNSAAWELCEDWRMLASGRMHLIEHANFWSWFGPLFDKVPQGLVAELLWANGMCDSAARVLEAHPPARAHVLALPESCFGLDEEEWLQLGGAIDLARCLEARRAAAAAVREALREC